MNLACKLFDIDCEDYSKIAQNREVQFTQLQNLQAEDVNSTNYPHYPSNSLIQEIGAFLGCG